MTHKCFCGDRQRVDYFDGDRGILILEELERISYMKKFRDMEYHFIKTNWCKDGNHPLNTTLVLVMGNYRFQIQCYYQDINTEKVSK